MTDDTLRAALERLAHPELVEAPGGFYCPWCGTNVDVHGTTCPVPIARAAGMTTIADLAEAARAVTAEMNERLRKMYAEAVAPAVPALDVERLEEVFSNAGARLHENTWHVHTMDLPAIVAALRPKEPTDDRD